MPAASAAPMTAPSEVPTMWLGVRPACSNARKAPAWASALAPPPESTRTTLLTAPLVIAPFHDPIRAPLRRPLVAPLFVRRFGHDRRDTRGIPVLVQRDVGDVARIRVAAVARQHV